MLRSNLWWLLANMIAAGLLSLLANLYPGAYMQTTEPVGGSVHFNNCPVDGYHVPKTTPVTFTCIASPHKRDIQVHLYFGGLSDVYYRVNTCTFGADVDMCVQDVVAKGYMDFEWFTGPVNGVTFTYKDRFPYPRTDEFYNATVGCDDGVECWIFYYDDVPTTTPVPNEETTNDEPSGGKLGAGPIVGIVFGSLLLLAACAIGAFLVWRKKCRKPADESCSGRAEPGQGSDAEATGCEEKTPPDAQKNGTSKVSPQQQPDIVVRTTASKSATLNPYQNTATLTQIATQEAELMLPAGQKPPPPASSTTQESGAPDEENDEPRNAAMLKQTATHKSVVQVSFPEQNGPAANATQLVSSATDSRPLPMPKNTEHMSTTSVPARLMPLREKGPKSLTSVERNSAIEKPLPPITTPRK